MPTPLAKTSEVLVLDEINKKAHLQLTFSDVVFGPPLINPDPSNGRNTIMAVNSRPGRYFGNKAVYYNRLNLTTLFQQSGFDVIELVRPDPFTSTIQLLPELNSTYGLALTGSDIVDENPPEDEEFDLVARPTSYGFTGVLRVRVVEPQELLIEDAIYLNTLQALEYPDADLFGVEIPEHDVGLLGGALAIQDDHMRLNPNYAPEWFYKATNGELSMAIAVRRQAASIQAPTVFDDDGRYILPLATGESMSILLSLELMERAGLPADIHSLTARYEISLFVRSLAIPSNNMVIWRLARVAGQYVWQDQLGVAVPVSEQISGPGSTAHLLSQTRISMPVTLPQLPTMGEFDIGLVAYRKMSFVPRLYLACKAVVSAGV